MLFLLTIFYLICFNGMVDSLFTFIFSSSVRHRSRHGGEGEYVYHQSNFELLFKLSCPLNQVPFWLHL